MPWGDGGRAGREDGEEVEEGPLGDNIYIYIHINISCIEYI